MKKTGKIILGLVVAIIAAVAVVVFLGLQNINGLIKRVIETEGSKVTGTAVLLDSANVKLLEGRGELHGLQISNPAGYSSGYAFSMGQIALQIDPASLTNNVIVINEVLVDGASVIAEQKTLSQINLQDLLNTVKAASSKSGKAASTANTSSAPADAAAEDVRLMIEKFSFINSDVQLITSEWGEHSMQLPDIRVNNIGDKKTGLTPEQLTQAMLQPILAQAKASVAKQLEQLAKAKAKEKLQEEIDEKLSDEEKGQLNTLKGLFSQ